MGKTSNNSVSNSLLVGKPHASVTPETVRLIKERLASKEKPSEVAASMNLGYMLVYKIATGETWKDVGAPGRLVERRKPKMKPLHREFAWKAKRKAKWTNARIARKLKVSETTVARLLRDARALLAVRVHRMLLTSGSNALAMRTYNLKSSEIDDLVTHATLHQLPKRLSKELENDP